MADMTVRRDVPGFAENEPGTPVPVLKHVFAHTDDLVIATTGCEAYPTGIAFRLLVLSKPPIDFVTEFAFGVDQRRHAGSLDLTASATLRDGSQQPIVRWRLGDSCPRRLPIRGAAARRRRSGPSPLELANHEGR
jgi:hypothetical protein